MGLLQRMQDRVDEQARRSSAKDRAALRSEQELLLEAALGQESGGLQGPFRPDLVNRETGLSKGLLEQNPQQRAATQAGLLAATGQRSELAPADPRQGELDETARLRGIADLENVRERTAQTRTLREKGELEIERLTGQRVTPMAAQQILLLEDQGIALQEGDRSLRQAIAIVDRFSDAARLSPGTIQGIAAATGDQLIPLGQAIFKSGVLNEGEADRFKEIFGDVGSVGSAILNADATVVATLQEWLGRVERQRGNLSRQVSPERGLAPGFDQDVFSDLAINPELRNADETLAAEGLDANDFEEVNQPGVSGRTIERILGGSQSIDFLQNVGGGLLDFAKQQGGR